MISYSENTIVNLSFNFALKIVILTEKLELVKKYNVSNQLFRSGTSIGANIKEAQSAESKSDFIHKMKLAAKEAEETEYWLNLCKFSENYPNPNELLNEIEVIKKMLSKIISTSKSIKIEN